MSSVPIAPRPSRRWRVAVATTAAGAAVGVAFVGVGPAQASSHREAPLIAGDPRADNTDVYAFVSPDKPGSVNLIANWIPFEEPNGGPNFYPFEDGTHYDINIDSNGNAKPDIIYRWTFKSVDARGTTTFLYNNGPVTSLTDKNLLYRQNFTLTKYENGHWKVVSKGHVAPSDVGTASMPNYRALRDAAITTVTGGGQTFAGRADDPFFLDLRVFDLLYGGNLPEVGRDTLKGYNVNSIALQVPTDMITESSHQPVVGIWSTTQRRNAQGYYSQVSRLGNPLVNEVVNPLKDKDKFNASSPYDDAQFLKNVTNPELPKLIEGIYKIKAPAEPRNDLVDVFLKGVKGLNQPPKVRAAEELRLNTSIKPTADPKRLGVLDGDNAGFPNGRRLTDDVIDEALQVVEGELVGSKNDLGDAVDKNDKKFEKYFPYVAEPTSGSRGALAKGTTSGSDVKSQLGD